MTRALLIWAVVAGLASESIVAGLLTPAMAQTGPPGPNMIVGGYDSNGKPTSLTLDPTTGNLKTIPYSGTGDTTSVTVGTGDGVVLAAPTSGQRVYLRLANESGTATVRCAFGTAAISADTAGQETFLPYSSTTWESTFVPNDAVHCISSASSTPFTVIAR